jgi:seryl-tRNA synthetase
LHAENCRRRNYPELADTPFRIVELYRRWHELEQAARELRELNNALRLRLQALPESAQKERKEGEVEEEEKEDGGGERRTVLRELADIKERLAPAVDEQAHIQLKMVELAEALPNLTSIDTPVGDKPRVLGYINDGDAVAESLSDDASWKWKSHVEIAQLLDLIDFRGGSVTSGWGWYFLKREAALLEQALVQYALDVAARKGWVVATPPSIVYSSIGHACGFRPRGQQDAQQVWTLQQAAKDARKPPLCLAATAEIAFAGMHANSVLEKGSLPQKFVGVSRCYRPEAGARGADTKGLYRVHEFTKVEMFAWTLPDQEQAEGKGLRSGAPTPSEWVFNEIVGIQKEILGSLGLPCRVLEMPASELGASATRKQDIEVYFPSRRRPDPDREGKFDVTSGWGEVTSASMCSDFQTRRLATRMKKSGRGHAIKNPNTFPYTVNGTALAVPRVLAALLEYGWDEGKKTVRLPQVLKPWMGGKDWIGTFEWEGPATPSGSPSGVDEKSR